MKDLIYRQAAIDSIEEITWYHQNGNKEMVRGANSSEHQAWYKAEDVYEALEKLPSAQPEIIQCKDCKHRPTATSAEGGVYWDFSLDFPDAICPLQGDGFWYSQYPEDDFYCAYGERKE